MNKNGPILVIEDDIDDQDILQEIFNNLDYNNEVLFFSDGLKALDFISCDDNYPFLILSDVNMPKLDGFDLRHQLFNSEKLKGKCVPYLFFTTGTHKKAVVDAYALSVQGFFIKPSNVTALESTLRKIIEYWKACISPCHFN